MDEAIQKKLLAIFVDELQEQHEAMTSMLLKLEKSNEADLQELLQGLFRTSHNIKGAAKSVAIDSVATISHRLEDLFSEWRDQNHRPDDKKIKACLQVADNMLQAFHDHSNGETHDLDDYLAPLTGKQSTLKSKNKQVVNETSLKIPLRKIEHVNAKVDEFITHQLKLDKWLDILKSSYKKVKDLNTKIPNKELAEISDNIENLCDNGNQFYGDFSRSLTMLQDNLRSMRLLPIATIEPFLQRSVHDISNSLNKQVELIVEDNDIELDKPILDLIKDPLQHLIRNAIDHGIEDADTRKKKSKPEKAKITLQVFNDSGKVKILFKDDGTGIDIAKIRAKANSLSAFSNAEIDRMTERDVLQLIFHSGFSTREQVSELSGRGVGLDIVHQNIEKAKGNISIATEKDKGTTFTITLPLTLTTTRGLFLKFDENYFMINTLSINRILEINTSEIHHVNNEFVYPIKDKPIPIKSLAKLLGSNDKINPKKSSQGILLDYNDRQVILHIQDNIEDEHDCIVKPLPAPYDQSPLFTGVTLTGLSDLVLVINARKLFDMALSFKEEIAVTDSKQSKKTIKKCVLVVDDSLTTRSLTVNSLELSGYIVLSAKDGSQAWSLVNSEHIDCVVSDIEMPNMNGIELIKRIKAESKFTNIPIIIVSSHESEEEKEFALESGADSYLVKSHFDTRSLLKTIESLL